jgi:hypothetical protein
MGYRSKGLLFSEEKRSKKDFIRLRRHRRGLTGHGGFVCRVGKVFWFFFSKKNRFLPYHPLIRGQTATTSSEPSTTW